MSTTTYTADGTYTWTCPEGVTSVQVECWGAGGGGGRGGIYAGQGGDGGGGGAYSKKNSVTVVPGTGYTVVVGNGGFSDTAGGDTYFKNTSTVLAKGGQNGQQEPGDGILLSQGGQASEGVGDVKYSGGDGGGDAKNAGGGGGSSAGTAADGNDGSVPTVDEVGGNGGSAPSGGGAGGKGGNYDDTGSAGGLPGGGGGGGGRGATDRQNGGQGRDGQVILTYYAAYSDTRSETVDASETVSTSGTYVNTISETAVASESISALGEYDDTFSESASVGDESGLGVWYGSEGGGYVAAADLETITTSEESVSESAGYGIDIDDDSVASSDEATILIDYVDTITDSSSVDASDSDGDGDWTGTTVAGRVTVADTESVTASEVVTFSKSIRTDYLRYIGFDDGTVHKLSEDYLSDNGATITSEWETIETDLELPGTYKTVYRCQLRYVDKSASAPLYVQISIDGGQTWAGATKTCGTGDGKTKSQWFWFVESGEYFKFKIGSSSADKDFRIIGLDIDFLPCGLTVGS